MMKLTRFFRKRWHGIPVGILSVVLAICLIGGSVSAAYMAFNGNANVTVVEALTFSNTTGDGGEGFSSGPYDASWSVSLYPGESKFLNVLVSNAALNDLSISATCSPGVQGVTAAWSGSSTVPGSGSVVLTLTVTAGDDASPSTQAIYFQISRG